jgi:hypothetical protein
LSRELEKALRQMGFARAGLLLGQKIYPGLIKRGPEMLPYILGGWNNVAVRAYVDQTNGTNSSDEQNGASFAFGAATAYVTEGASVPFTVGATALSASFESLLVDRQFSVRQVAASVVGSFLSRIAAPASQLGRSAPATSAALSSIKQAAVELLGQITTLRATQPRVTQ